MTDTDPDELLPDLDRLRARVRADQRATSAPLLAFGALVLAYAAVVGLFAGRLDAAGRHVTALLYWPLATTAGLIALWWWERRRAAVAGVGEGRRPYRRATRAYLVALVLIVVLFVPVLFIGVFTPLVWPAAVFAAIAAWRRDRLLGRWAAVIGVIGGADSVIVIAAQGFSADRWWVQPLVDAVLGLVLVAGGLVTGRRERDGA